MWTQHGTQPRRVPAWPTGRKRGGPRRWPMAGRGYARGAPMSNTRAAQAACPSVQCPAAPATDCPWPEQPHTSQCLRGVQTCPRFRRVVYSPACSQRKTQGVQFLGAKPPAPAATEKHTRIQHDTVGSLLDQALDYSDESDEEPDVLVTNPATLDVITLDCTTQNKKDLFALYKKAMIYHLVTFALVTFLALYVGDANRRDVSGLCLRFPSLRGCEAERKGMLEDQGFIDLNREITSLVNDSTIVRELIETNRKCSQNQNILIYTCLALLVLTVVGCCLCCLKAYLEINKCLGAKDSGLPAPAPARRPRW